MKRGSLLNLTPHDIVLYNGNQILDTIPSRGSLRLVEQEAQHFVDGLLNIPVVGSPVYTGVDKPELLDDECKNIIVSMVVAQWMTGRREY